MTAGGDDRHQGPGSAWEWQGWALGPGWALPCLGGACAGQGVRLWRAWTVDGRCCRYRTVLVQYPIDDVLVRPAGTAALMMMRAAIDSSLRLCDPFIIGLSARVEGRGQQSRLVEDLYFHLRPTRTVYIKPQV